MLLGVVDGEAVEQICGDDVDFVVSHHSIQIFKS